MKYLYIFLIFALLSCEGETYVEYSKSVTAKFSYPINSTSPVYIDFQTVKISSLAGFLANKANGSLPNQITAINIQSITLNTATDFALNTASSIDVTTQVGKIPCIGSQVENLTQFTTEQNIPIGLSDIWTSFDPIIIKPSGITAVNEIIATVLPAKSNRGPDKYWVQDCETLAVYVNGKINPPDKKAKLNLDVNITFNIIYGNCEEDPFYNALAPGGTCEF